MGGRSISVMMFGMWRWSGGTRRSWSNTLRIRKQSNKRWLPIADIYSRIKKIFVLMTFHVPYLCFITWGYSEEPSSNFKWRKHWK
ncbi:unnamed protein product [Musa acuminata subsp. malaccensis]|uniref:(wild Malaysian banana) hypothetical protein n=1 Tax=Musa acuminata subsp. malaccensis TaxID=214687 RepID=A0A804IN68_MUSAM|nr:unnamed protein product [Musa acuminata subsp. malaccensis]